MSRGRATSRGPAAPARGPRAPDPHGRQGLDEPAHRRWLSAVRGLASEQVRVHLPERGPALALGGRPSPVIGVDLDSTVFPLLDAIAAFPEHSGFAMAEVGTWDYLVDRFGGIGPLLELFERAMERSHCLGIPPYEGALPALEALVARHNARLVVMTDRPLGRVEDTIAYADHHRLPYTALVCGKLPDKVSVCDALGATVLIDDRPSTIEAAHRAGIAALTLAHPYTEEVRARLGLAEHPDWDSLAGALGALLAGPARL